MVGAVVGGSVGAATNAVVGAATSGAAANVVSELMASLPPHADSTDTTTTVSTPIDLPRIVQSLQIGHAQRPEFATPEPEPRYVRVPTITGK